VGYFADLIDDGLIERPLEVKGKTKPTWWRQLTAGQRVELLRGQMVKSDGIMEMELSANAERNHRLVLMTLCDESGTPVYKSLKDVQAEPSWLIDALVRLANEVNKDEGNG